MPKIVKTVPQQLWSRTPRNVFRLDLTTARFEQLMRVERAGILLGDVCYIAYGAQISSSEKGGFGRGKYLARNSNGMKCPKRLYEGRDMRPFAIVDKGLWLDYRPDEMYGPRTPQFFNSPKLSVRYVSGDYDTFLAWVDEGGYYT